MSLERALEEIVRATPWLMGALRTVRGLGVPEAYIGSGAIRNAVWDVLHEAAEPSFLADVDVPYFDAADLSEGSEAEHERRLRELKPELNWDVKNQAAVHLWFHEVFGHRVEPLTSIEHAVSTWPEPATCVAVRLRADERLDIVAPLGLADLFGMVVRRNPARVSVETYRKRVEQKRYAERWPKVRVIAVETS